MTDEEYMTRVIERKNNRRLYLYNRFVFDHKKCDVKGVVTIMRMSLFINHTYLSESSAFPRAAVEPNGPLPVTGRNSDTCWLGFFWVYIFNMNIKQPVTR